MENTLVNTDATTATLVPGHSQMELSRPAPIHIAPPGSLSSPLRLIEVPFVHRKLIIGCILAAMVLTWLALLLWPRKFASEAKLMIRVGRESVSLDPTATVGSQTLLIQKTRMEEVVSALGVLESRKVMEAVVDELGDKNVLSGYLPTEEVKQSAIKKFFDSSVGFCRAVVGNVLFATGIQDRISDKEMAVRKLEKSVAFFSPKESTVVTVVAKAKSPQMAQAIAQSTTDVFVRNHMEVTRTPGATGFFERQASDLEDKLGGLIASRTDFMQENELMSVASNQEILRTELVAISTELAGARGQLKQAEAELDKANITLASLPKSIVASRQERANDAHSGMRQKLFELETRQQRMKASFTAEHPMRAAIAEQITELREIVETEQPVAVDENTTPNPSVQRVEAVIQDLRTRIAGLNSLIAKKELQHQKKSDEVESLLGQEKQLIAMDRDIKVLDSTLDSLKVKLEESRVIDDMGRDQISNVSVFQPATFIERAVNPNKKLVASMALMLGSLLGLAWAFTREMASDILRSEDHLRQIAHATPVYGLDKLRGIHVRQHRPVSRREPPKSLQHLCKHILGDVLLSEDWGEQQRLGVLSYDRGSGASMLARELALACSNDCGIATTLVDTDLEGQAVAKSFGVKKPIHIDDFAGGKMIDEANLQQGEKLRVLPLTSPKKGKAKLNGELDGLIDRLKQVGKESGEPHNHVAIVDLPPVRDYPEAAALARTLDSVVVVVESEKTTASEVNKMLRYLEGGEARVLCFVLNKTKRHVPRWLQKAIGT